MYSQNPTLTHKHAQTCCSSGWCWHCWEMYSQLLPDFVNMASVKKSAFSTEVLNLGVMILDTGIVLDTGASLDTTPVWDSHLSNITMKVCSKPMKHFYPKKPLRFAVTSDVRRRCKTFLREGVHLSMRLTDASEAANPFLGSTLQTLSPLPVFISRYESGNHNITRA